MAKQKGGLGRGLDSLLGSMPSETITNSQRNKPTPIETPEDREQVLEQEISQSSTQAEMPPASEDNAVSTSTNTKSRIEVEKDLSPYKVQEEKRLPVKKTLQDSSNTFDDNEPYEINEDNLTIKSVKQREVVISHNENKPVFNQDSQVQGNTLEDEKVKDADELDINLIQPNPNQPRTNFKKEELEELAESIQKSGLLQPIVVRKVEDTYQIIAGERRWQACKLINLERVPVRVIEADDDEAITLALIENIQRSDLNPIEEAYGYRRMMERGKMTQTQVAQAVSKGRSTIANALRLLELPEEAQQLLFEDKITAGHARAILSVPDKEGRIKLTQKLNEEKLSVRETEAIARLYAGKQNTPTTQRPQTPKSYKTVARSLRNVLQTDVRVKNSKGKNKIEITFKDEADLERLFRLIINE